jgi:hypothetical protein
MGARCYWRVTLKDWECEGGDGWEVRMSWQVKSMMVGMIPRSLPFKGSPHLSPSKSLKGKWREPQRTHAFLEMTCPSFSHLVSLCFCMTEVGDFVVSEVVDFFLQPTVKAKASRTATNTAAMRRTIEVTSNLGEAIFPNRLSD